MPRSWIEDIRRDALEIYEREPVPTFRRSGFWTTSLRELKLDELTPHHFEAVADRADLPEAVKDALGDQQLAGLIVQRGATVIYTELDPALADQGVILCSLEKAVEQHEDLVRKYLMQRFRADEGKFAAASAALWTGGAFLYVPRDVSIELPIQTVYTIDEAGQAQYGRTLAVADIGSKVYLREYYLAPDIDGQALHAGGFELFAEPSANVKLATFQDWGRGQIFDISTKRVQIAADAHCAWFPIHLGGHLTKQVLDIITAGRGADMRHNGVYFAEEDEHLDLYSTDRHEQGETTGDTVWKGALTGRARASYEGLIEIIEGAQGTNTYLQTHTMMLSPKAKADSIPSLIVKTDDVSASHGGTVGELDEEKLFYMMARGIARQDAIRILVEGYFEPVVHKLEDESLQKLVRDRVSAKLSAAAADIEAYSTAR